MIRYIDEHEDRFRVEPICRALRATAGGFLTSRGYRAAKTRSVSARALRDEMLVEELVRVHGALGLIPPTEHEASWQDRHKTASKPTPALAKQ